MHIFIYRNNLRFGIEPKFLTAGGPDDSETRGPSLSNISRVRYGR